MSSGVTISPAFQEVSLEASQSSKVVSVMVKNDSSQEVVVTPLVGELKLLSDEGKAQTEFVPREFVQSLSYVEPEQKEVRLAAGESASVSAVVKNNLTLSPGGHYFSLVLPLKKSGAEATDQVTPTLTSTVFLTKKGGEQYRLELVSAKAPMIVFGQPQLALRFHNTGNTHAVPYGKVVGRDVLGREVLSGIVNSDSQRIFPEHERVIEVPLKQTSLSLPISSYTLQVEGRVLPGDTLYSATARTVVVQPLQLLGWCVAIAFGVVSARFFWQKKHRRPPHLFEDL